MFAGHDLDRSRSEHHGCVGEENRRAVQRVLRGVDHHVEHAVVVEIAHADVGRGIRVQVPSHIAEETGHHREGAVAVVADEEDRLPCSAGAHETGRHDVQIAVGIEIGDCHPIAPTGGGWDPQPSRRGERTSAEVAYPTQAE